MQRVQSRRSRGRLWEREKTARIRCLHWVSDLTLLCGVGKEWLEIPGLRKQVVEAEEEDMRSDCDEVWRPGEN